MFKMALSQSRTPNVFKDIFYFVCILFFMRNINLLDQSKILGYMNLGLDKGKMSPFHASMVAYSGYGVWPVYPKTSALESATWSESCLEVFTSPDLSGG